MDGSPPLYYMLLSVWMDVVGYGPAETQALSVLIALLAVPVGLWAGWSLFGRRAGLICAALCAVNPFLTNYAQETRMYSLMLLLSLGLTAAFLHVFAFGRRSYLPLFAVLLALMLYTHNWGLFVAAAALVALIPCWRVSEDKSAFKRDVLLGFGGAALLYLPWVPTLIHQVLHTGAPWLDPPRFGAPVQIVEVAARRRHAHGGAAAGRRLGHRAAGGPARRGQGAHRDHRRRRAVRGHAGDRLARLAGLARLDHALPRRRARPDAADRRGRAGALGQARPGRARDRARRVVDPEDLRPEEQVERRRHGARRARPTRLLKDGDLVISMQPEQVPLINYHLPGKLQFATPLGRVDNPPVMDWTDAQDGMKEATTAKNLDPLLAKLPRSGRVLLVHPVTADANDWDAPWTALVRRRSAQWGAAVAGDSALQAHRGRAAFYRRATRIGVRGVLYEKTG